jgi:NAD(P)-dependent dehydrogenase (short-subunit alcohol dehydrogenase family)
MGRPDGEVAIVTGAGSGIGRAAHSGAGARR